MQLDWLSVKDVCERFGICKSSVYNLLNAGKLRGKKWSNRTIIDPASVAEFLASLPDMGKRNDG